MIKTKFCTKCKTTKESHLFHRNNASKDGLCYQCKVCARNYQIKSKDKIWAYNQVFFADKEQERKRKHEYYINNTDKVKVRNRKTEKRLLKTSITYKVNKYIRNRLYAAVKRDFKNGSAVGDLGCSIEEFKLYLESKWQPGMSWDNYAKYGWHIDHIIPLVKFDLSDREQLKIACHYSNLQPLWWQDNLRKGNK